MNKYSSNMETKKQIEEILLNDYGCFDDFTVDKLLLLFSVVGQSEQLKAFLEWFDKPEKLLDHDELIRQYNDESL